MLWRGQLCKNISARTQTDEYQALAVKLIHYNEGWLCLIPMIGFSNGG